MKAYRLLAVACCLALAACPSSAPQPGGDPVLLPVPEDPTVSFMVWFKVGSQDDPAGKEGLAALTGALLSDGSTTENSYETILKKLYPLASGYSARVDREMTTFTGRTHKDNLEAYFKLYTDAYLHPKFDQADFDRLKSDALNYLEKTLRYASDEELGKAAFFDFLFGDSSYAPPSVGTVAGLNAITLDDVKAFYEKYYTADNATVALGGGYDDALVDRFRGTLEELGEGEVATPPAPQPPTFSGRHVLLVDKPGADASISFGFPIDLHRGDPDYYALWLANSWLGEHRNSSSHLYQVIREARGMNYGDYSYIEVFPEGGFRQMPPTNVARRAQAFEVWIRTLPNEQAIFALRAALKEIDQLVENGLTEEQFELTRSFLKKYVLHFATTTRERLGYAVDDRFYGIDEPGHLEMFRQAMDDLTLEQVNAAIRKYLQTENLKIAIVTGQAQGLQEILVNDTPTPMTYGSPKPPELLAEDEIIASYPLEVTAENVTIVPVDEMFAGEMAADPTPEPAGEEMAAEGEDAPTS